MLACCGLFSNHKTSRADTTNPLIAPCVCVIQWIAVDGLNSGGGSQKFHLRNSKRLPTNFEQVQSRFFHAYKEDGSDKSSMWITMFHQKGTLTSCIVQQNILSRAIKVPVSLIGRYVGTSDGGMQAC